jgi:hypothetical protein
MFQTMHNGPAGIRRGPGPIHFGTLTQAAVVVVAGLGLASCVGPYADDGYSHVQYRAGTSYDAGYDQRRGAAYRPDPHAALDRRPRYGWWYDNAYPRGRDGR